MPGEAFPLTLIGSPFCVVPSLYSVGDDWSPLFPLKSMCSPPRGNPLPHPSPPGDNYDWTPASVGKYSSLSSTLSIVVVNSVVFLVDDVHDINFRIAFPLTEAFCCSATVTNINYLLHRQKCSCDKNCKANKK